MWKLHGFVEITCSFATSSKLNTVPGMTEKSLVPMAAAKNGLTFDDLVLKILNKASLENGFNNEY